MRGDPFAEPHGTRLEHRIPHRRWDQARLPVSVFRRRWICSSAPGTPTDAGCCRAFSHVRLML